MRALGSLPRTVERRFGLLATLLCAACAPGQVTISLPPLPDGVDRVAVLVTDASGAVISTSGLLAVGDPPPRFDVDADVPDDAIAGAWVVGHGALSLPSAVRPDAATLSSARVRVVGSLDRQLGPPQWAARGARDGAVIAVDAVMEAPPPLGASWLDRCPILFPGARAIVDIECKEQACPATAEQAGCTLTIDASRCTYGHPSGLIDSDGAIGFDPSSPLGTCDRGGPGPDPGSLRFECDAQSARRCMVTLYPRSDEPRFTIESVTLGPGVQTQPTFERPPMGFVPAMAISGATVFASVLDAPASATSCRDIGSTLAMVDVTSHELTSTATAPPCLVQLASDPIGEGRVIGVFHDGAWRLGRFDASGRRVATVPLALPADATVIALVADPPTARDPELALLVQTSTAVEVALIDAATLRARDIYVLDVAEPKDLLLAPTSIVVLDDFLDQVRSYDRFTGARSGFQDVRGDDSDELMARVVAHGADTVVTASARRGAVKRVERGLVRATAARPYEDFVQAYGVGPWPPDPSQLLVGLTGIFDDPGVGRDPDRNEAFVTLFDGANTRLVPRMMRIGRGPVGHVLAGAGASGTWVSLPWESRLVYVTPR